MPPFLQKVFNANLVVQIIVFLLLGIVFALIWPEGGAAAGIFGKLFVNALKAVAPILVFILVTHAITKHERGGTSNIRTILILYILGTFAAAAVAVIASYIYPLTLSLSFKEATDIAPPADIKEVLRTLLFKMVDNPVNAAVEGNYIGILVWAAMGGIALRHSSDATKAVIDDIAQMISKIVGWVIRLAPLGIFGLIASAIAETGLETLSSYAQIVALLLCSMLFVALVVNPFIVWVVTRKNPFPLIFTCLMESGITAFFMRSSAANIPVNMRLCEKLGLKEETYSISIPLGATINMAGAAITITVMTLAAANTVGLEVHIVTALLLCVLATFGACGASGVPGGSLLLIPMACSLFQIDATISAQVVGIGFIIGVIQDSAETALNSSTDVIYTAAADIAARRKSGELDADTTI